MKKYFLILLLLATINTFAAQEENHSPQENKSFLSAIIERCIFILKATEFGLSQVYPLDLHYKNNTRAEEDTAFLKNQSFDSEPTDTHQDLCQVTK